MPDKHVQESMQSMAGTCQRSTTLRRPSLVHLDPTPVDLYASALRSEQPPVPIEAQQKVSQGLGCIRAPVVVGVMPN